MLSSVDFCSGRAACIVQAAGDASRHHGAGGKGDGRGHRRASPRQGYRSLNPIGRRNPVRQTTGCRADNLEAGGGLVQFIEFVLDGARFVLRLGGILGRAWGREGLRRLLRRLLAELEHFQKFHSP